MVVRVVLMTPKVLKMVTHLDFPHTGRLWRIVGRIEGRRKEALVSTETTSTAWTRGQRVLENRLEIEVSVSQVKHVLPSRTRFAQWDL